MSLTDNERLTRDLAARALSLGSSEEELACAPAAADLVIDLSDWLVTRACLNEEVVEAALPKLRAEQAMAELSVVSCATATDLALYLAGVFPPRPACTPR